MSEYHVGTGLGAIYAGTLKKSGEWKDKSEVTDEVVCAAAEYLLEKNLNFNFNLNGKKYKMKVVEE